MSFETILFETRGPVGLLTFNRPESLNAFNGRMIDETNALMDQVEKDDSIRALVVAGAGRAFSAGFDLKESAGRSWGTVADVAPVLRKDFDFIMRFWHFAKPTIAAVNGLAAGAGAVLAAIRKRDPDQAVALVKGYDGPAAPLRTALTQAAAEDNSTASIMVAHAVKTTTAAITESAAGGRAPLAAAARFLAAPKRERFVYQATLDAIDFIQGRAKGDTPE